MTLKANTWRAAVIVTAEHHSARQPTPDRVIDPVAAALRVLAEHGIGVDASQVSQDSAAAAGATRLGGGQVQGRFFTGEEAVRAVHALCHAGGWHIGLGVGTVAEPVPAAIGDGLGPAYPASRAALEAARRTSAGLAVRTLRPPRATAQPAAAGRRAARVTRATDVEAVLWLLVGILRRRSEHGWRTALLLDSGLTRTAVAAALDISTSAVSQRANSAAYAESVAGSALAARLLDRALTG